MDVFTPESVRLPTLITLVNRACRWKHQARAAWFLSWPVESLLHALARLPSHLLIRLLLTDARVHAPPNCVWRPRRRPPSRRRRPPPRRRRPPPRRRCRGRVAHTRSAGSWCPHLLSTTARARSPRCSLPMDHLDDHGDGPVQYVRGVNWAPDSNDEDEDPMADVAKTPRATWITLMTKLKLWMP